MNVRDSIIAERHAGTVLTTHQVAGFVGSLVHLGAVEITVMDDRSGNTGAWVVKWKNLSDLQAG
jgi:hypothetical protein